MKKSIFVSVSLFASILVFGFGIFVSGCGQVAPVSRATSSPTATATPTGSATASATSTSTATGSVSPTPTPSG